MVTWKFFHFSKTVLMKNFKSNKLPLKMSQLCSKDTQKMKNKIKYESNLNLNKTVSVCGTWPKSCLPFSPHPPAQHIKTPL